MYSLVLAFVLLYTLHDGGKGSIAVEDYITDACQGSG